MPARKEFDGSSLRTGVRRPHHTGWTPPVCATRGRVRRYANSGAYPPERSTSLQLAYLSEAELASWSVPLRTVRTLPIRSLNPGGVPRCLVSLVALDVRSQCRKTTARTFTYHPRSVDATHTSPRRQFIDHMPRDFYPKHTHTSPRTDYRLVVPYALNLNPPAAVPNLELFVDLVRAQKRGQLPIIILDRVAKYGFPPHAYSLDSDENSLDHISALKTHETRSRTLFPFGGVLIAQAQNSSTTTVRARNDGRGTVPLQVS